MTGFTGIVPFFTFIRDFWFVIPMILQSLIMAVFGIFILIIVIRMFK